MKTRILKRINKQIRIVEKNDRFVVEHKPFGDKEWKIMNDFSSLKRAIDRKNSYIVMVLMRDLGYRNEFINRRTKRNKKKYND